MATEVFRQTGYCIVTQIPAINMGLHGPIAEYKRDKK